MQAYSTALVAEPTPPTSLDWLGFYTTQAAQLPILIAKGLGRCNIICEQRLPISILELPNQIYSVNPIFRTLSRIPNIHIWFQAHHHQLTTLELNLGFGDKLTCIVKKVRITEVKKSTQKLPTNFFYGPIQQLEFDPHCYC